MYEGGNASIQQAWNLRLLWTRDYHKIINIF